MCINRSVIQRVTRATLLRNFTQQQLKDKGYPFHVLSVFNGQLLISSSVLKELYVLSENGDLLSTLKVTDFLMDASWTPRGNIVYTTWHSKKVVAMSRSGTAISQTQMTDPRLLSVSTDDVIYLADWESGVYESTDDGATWSKVFQSPDGGKCWQVIKVKTNDNCDDFWTLETDNKDKWRVRVYSVNRRRAENVTWRDVAVTTSDGKQVGLGILSRLALDGHTNIFLSELNNQAVHVLSSSGGYERQLLSSDHFVYPWRLAVDRERHLLYVGQEWGKVGVFTMTYENER